MMRSLLEARKVHPLWLVGARHSSRCNATVKRWHRSSVQPNSCPGTRTRTFNEWLGLLRPLCDAVAELLWLTRQNGRARKEVAAGGTFNITFDRDNPLQLLRISLPASAGLYPEISGSHYRCNVRFLAWKGLEKRSAQTDADVPFVLSCCT